MSGGHHQINHDDVIKWKHLPRYWPFVRGIHRCPVNSPYKGQWRGALMFSLICTRINGWVNNGEAGDFRRHRAHYDVTVPCSVRDEMRRVYTGSIYLLLRVIMNMVRQQYLLAGIGKCIARKLAACGATVIALSRTPADLKAIQAEVRSSSVCLCNVPIPMARWHCDAFCVTGPLWGESTGPLVTNGFSLTKDT